MDKRKRIAVGIRRRETSLKIIDSFCKGKILDVGSNYGATSNYFHKKGFDVEGKDIDKILLSKAKKRYPGVRFFFGDITKEIKKYDTILLIGVLEEINFNPIDLLKKIKLNLNPNGRIVIAVRNFNSLKRRVKCFLGLEPVDSPMERLWIFTKNRLLDVINLAGYQLVMISSSKKEVWNYLEIPCPNLLADEIWAVIEPKKE